MVVFSFKLAVPLKVVDIDYQLISSGLNEYCSATG